eukprot:CAMPEP_0117077622 /NCGR_PEP_ID=MMETSP0472-20121206/54723_1 /TAXON_ID=693140 ORGANISM="Tiarina fusus, Strain LIS" /NCGR_SAMPLE_ID=MMETSP0472 /ASSEMBLY_ACC=CAM_ASM_000603 /LENGTH=276 /DNA_ID=CAMNT_0004804017 /DNA_START=222 /DNA_END=1052 /DNA_ORIENTATION=-
MDGNGTLFGTLSGNTRTVLHKFYVDLPKKHGRGGQSALRFARLRMEKRHNYVRKVCEASVQQFIEGDKVNVSGIILAGLADFKNELVVSEMFDTRLKSKVIKIVDISYGGENGFHQAIELASDALQNVKFVQEKVLLSSFFAEIAQDSGKYCFGVVNTLRALELGAVETLVVWENFPIIRYTLRDMNTNEEIIKFLNEDDENFDAKEQMEIIDSCSLVEWLANNYSSFGCSLEFVSDKSQEGCQFCRGFGGFGGILRYRVDFLAMDYDSDSESDDE